MQAARLRLPLTTLQAGRLHYANDAHRVSPCRAVTSPPLNPYSFVRWTWAVGSSKFTTYTHTAPPNAEFVDCMIATGVQPLPGSFAARSRHNGGVSCLMGDGNVRFVSSTIDLHLWRALGTRDGGETVDE